MKYNKILDTDSYKFSHYLQYLPKTEYVSSYIESRGGEYDELLFCGPQMWMKKFFNKPITRKEIDYAEERVRSHGLPFNREGFMHILNQHDGWLPLSIQAVDEGLIIPTKNVLVQVKNTDPLVPWLTSFIETTLLRAVWYPTTVATNSYHIKKIIKECLYKTCDNPDAELPFKLHDFGFRGVSSYESAGIGGLAHLINFMGTDTIAAIEYAKEYYGESMAGFSIPAAEHSTITSWGMENETAAYKNMISKFAKPNSLVAVVSDSYDIYNAVDNIWGKKLKDDVINSGATIVVRPDSGNPPDIVEDIAIRLANAFGTHTNNKGYNVLPSSVRIIQGDGINKKTITEILTRLENKKFSAEIVAFGMGGALLQEVNRDTCKFAMKANAIKKSDGIWENISKNPKTDPGKASKPGRLALIKKNGVGYETVPEMDGNGQNLLKTIYQNGKILVNHTLDDLRKRSNE